jgi:putative transposase
MSTTRSYPTDLTGEQWALLLALLPARKWRPGGPGRPPYAVRRVLNGILYLLKAGCQWRLLPWGGGKWNTGYAYCTRWRREGGWATRVEALRQLERRRLGRRPEPSAGSVDSQSIKTATQRAEGGFDGGKQVKGRTRVGGYARAD